MNDPVQAKRRQGGFTLIEILVTIAITAIVLAALIGAFRDQEIVFQQQTDLTKSAASARAAMQIMSRDVRLAGYTGLPLGWEKVLATGNVYPVASLKDGSTTLPAPSFLHDIAVDIAAISGNTKADAIAIAGNFSRDSTTLKTNVYKTATQLTVNKAGLFSATDYMKPAWLMIGKAGADIKAELFRISSVSGGTTAGTITIDGNFNDDYLSPGDTATGILDVNPPAIVSPVYLRVYYVKPNDTGLTGTREPSLYVRNYYDPNDKNAFTEVLLAQGVIDLQLSYNLAGTGGMIELNKGMVCDPCTIRAVKITLETWSDKFRKNKPLLREFSTSVRVRNMGFNLLNCSISGCTY